MNIFKIEYNWYEGEHWEILLGKDVEAKKFEEDLIKAKEFAESLMGNEIKEGDYLGKGYMVQCLPEFYKQIVWFLTSKLNYIECDYDGDLNYEVDDDSDKKIGITKIKQKIERSEIK